ncbi:MAG: class I SAM-dependent methyltransferase [Chloroflexota bacterium]|nr:class I SAM-dependent methyltransferase [Chloroflexota bacterium]
MKDMEKVPDHSDLKRFYDTVYHRDAMTKPTSSGHLRRLASRLTSGRGQRILDVACGAGEWLLTVEQFGAIPFGIDISRRAICACRERGPSGHFAVAAAENLPFRQEEFDLVTCLGSLEHFLSPESALDEMLRVGSDDATYLFLVPNSGFLTSRLGLWHGTEQAGVREETRALSEWRELFEAAGLRIESRWRDLHVLSWGWITADSWIRLPLRALQAVALILWPPGWQYQLYYLCRKNTKQ